MKIQIGSGGIRLPGFLNVDIRRAEGVDIVGHAGHLPEIADGSVEVLFAKSVFEHVFLAHQLPVLREWKRVLSETGIIICLGIPDFREIVQRYLAGDRGMIGERFDLYNIYRYTHGDPEQTCPVGWRGWRPDLHPDEAPPGWLPQLHKGLFDPDYLRQLLDRAELTSTIFRVGYPGEPHACGLGFLATRDREVDPARIQEILMGIPRIERWVDMVTVGALISPTTGSEQLLGYADTLSSRRSQFRMAIWQALWRGLGPLRSLRRRLLHRLT